MTVAISTQMSANLVSLMSVNSEMAGVQDRLATGKKINSVLDGAALYFRAKTLTEKAQAYDPVNANIDAALSNVKVADKAIETMYSNLNSLLTTLRDARSKAIVATAVAATNNATATAYLPATGGQTLVDTGATALNDETRFQVGDVFAISFTDALNNTVTRFFRATTSASVGVTGGAAGTVTSGNGTGVGAANPFNFSSASELVTAFNATLGRDDIQLNLDTTTGKFNLQGANIGTSFSIAQTTNAGTPTAGIANATVDFERMFGTSDNIVRSGGNGATIFNGTGNTAIVGTMITVTGSGSAATAANLETRRLAADTYRSTLQQLNNIARDAYLPGFVNLLQGSTMEVNLNEDAGDVIQNVNIGGAVDPVSLGFANFNPTTGNDNISSLHFNGDAINSAVTRVTAAMTALRSRQNALANHTAMLSTRLDFNKSFQGIVGDAATAITAADANEEAATMAALQNRQAYAVNNLSVTKGAEQSLLQLLR
ncbi:MAG: hypothetical protein O9972_42865 [Burkholderiales bacterium]|nr:hypothetical protein [Burkholderiales bacterium]